MMVPFFLFVMMVVWMCINAYIHTHIHTGAKLTKNYAGELGTLAGEPAKDRPLDAYR